MQVLRSWNRRMWSLLSYLVLLSSLVWVSRHQSARCLIVDWEWPLELISTLAQLYSRVNPLCGISLWPIARWHFTKHSKVLPRMQPYHWEGKMLELLTWKQMLIYCFGVMIDWNRFPTTILRVNKVWLTLWRKERLFLWQRFKRLIQIRLLRLISE